LIYAGLFVASYPQLELIGLVLFLMGCCFTFLGICYMSAYLMDRYHEEWWAIGILCLFLGVPTILVISFLLMFSRGRTGFVEAILLLFILYCGYYLSILGGLLLFKIPRLFLSRPRMLFCPDPTCGIGSRKDGNCPRCDSRLVPRSSFRPTRNYLRSCDRCQRRSWTHFPGERSEDQRLRGVLTLICCGRELPMDDCDPVDPRPGHPVQGLDRDTRSSYRAYEKNPLLFLFQSDVCFHVQIFVCRNNLGNHILL